MTSSSSSARAGPQIGQKRKRCFNEWELCSLLVIEFFKQKKIIELLRVINGNFSLACGSSHFTQKYYGLARQCLVRKMCPAGRPTMEAFDYIKGAKKHDPTTAPLEDPIDVNILYE